jgi:hypothetical protein
LPVLAKRFALLYWSQSNCLYLYGRQSCQRSWRVSNSSAALFLLDISKAFDTIDRDFLYSIMAVLGAGEGMISQAKLRR